MIVCVILTSDVQVVAQPTGLGDCDQDALVALSASSRALVVWTTHCWFVYSLAGLLLSAAQMTSVHAEILAIDICDDDDDVAGPRLCVVYKAGEEGICVTEAHTLRLRSRQRDRHELCLQSNVIARSRQRQLVYTP